MYVVILDLEDDGELLIETKGDGDSSKKMMKYLKAHPELNLIISELYNYIITNKPRLIAKYAAEEFFGNKEVVAEWTSKLGIINPYAK